MDVHNSYTEICTETYNRQTNPKANTIEWFGRILIAQPMGNWFWCMTAAEYQLLPVSNDPYDIWEAEKRVASHVPLAGTPSHYAPHLQITDNRFEESEKQLFTNSRRLDAPSRFIIAIRLMAHFSAPPEEMIRILQTSDVLCWRICTRYPLRRRQRDVLPPRAPSGDRNVPERSSSRGDP